MSKKTATMDAIREAPGTGVNAFGSACTNRS